MSSYIKSLERYHQARVAEASAAAEAQAATEAKSARERLTPLKDRLARLLATIPVEVQREGLSLPLLQAGLRGRQRETAQSGQVGTALRQLGWRRERRWRGGADGFSALWYPPGN